MIADIVIQGFLYDEKSSFLHGSAKAPPLIREALWSDAFNSFAENGIDIKSLKIEDRGDHEVLEYFDIQRITKSNLAFGQKLFTLGGDHSITFPVVKALSEHLDEPFDILHIDAHGDLYHEFEGDPYSHACPFARIMESGLVGRLIQIGVRTLTEHQRVQAEKFGVEIIEMKDFTLSQLPKLQRPVYISLDIDGIDPAFAPGVSHQESGGLTPREVLSTFSNIPVPIVGADLVEFNLTRDYAGITQSLCGKMMRELLSLMT